MKNVLRIWSALILAIAPAGAAEYGIKSAADLAALRSKLAPGDVIVMADGEWRDQALEFRGKGEPSKPITLRPATPGKAVLAGNSTLLIDGEWLVLTGLLVRNGSGPAHGIALRGSNNRLTDSAIIGGTYRHFVRVWGTRNRIDHCALEGKTSAEPTLQIESEAGGPNYHRVDHNYFGPRPPLGANGGETIRIGYSHQAMNVSRTLVEDNLFDRCDGEIEIISSKSCENTYRGNTFLECGGMLTLRHGNRCVIDGNFFLGRHKKDSGGIRVIGEDHVIVNNYIDGVERGGFWITSGVPNSPLNRYVAAVRCFVVFNTVVDSAGPYVDVSNGLGDGGRTLKPESNTVANNLFVPGPRGKLLIGDEGANWRWMGNLVAAPAEPNHAGIRAADVKLTRGVDGLWRPTAESAAVGAAEGDFGAVRTDVDGQPRAAKKDVGCDQVSDAPTTRRPLARADVGPAW